MSKDILTAFWNCLGIGHFSLIPRPPPCAIVWLDKFTLVSFANNITSPDDGFGAGAGLG